MKKVNWNQDSIYSPLEISLQAAEEALKEPHSATHSQELISLVSEFEELVNETDYPDALNMLATFYLISNRLQDALSLLERCVKEKPYYTAAWANLAFARLQAGQVNDARVIFPRMLRSWANNADLHNLYGLFFAMQGNYLEAVDQYKRALAVRSPFDIAHNNLALAYETLGRREDALHHFQKATSLEPLYTRLGILEGGEIQSEAVERFRSHVEGNPLRTLAFYEAVDYFNTWEEKDKALQILGEALVIEPDFARYYTTLGCLEMNWEKREEAAEHLQMALTIDPTAYRAHISLGFYFGEEEQMNRVLDHFQRAIDLRPYYPDLYFHMGEAHLSEREWEEAITCFNRALIVHPFYEMALFKLGYAYQKSEQHERAFEAFSRLKSITPEFPDVDRYLKKAEKQVKPGLLQHLRSDTRAKPE